ncbi:MAG: hypothetical protein KGV45_00115, partial [Gammaproteobacteria bacterium]|nr:hypothetical protein [Gammaproteobacteria bacterium]
MKEISVKVYDTKETIGNIKLATKDGKPTIIKAQKGVNYEFFDHSIERAPNHIITKRHGDDLYVSFEKNGQDIDLIIEDFYDNDEQALIGIAEDGEYYHYIPDTGLVEDYVTQLEVNNVEGQALGGEVMASPLWVVLPVGFPWWVGLGLIPLLFIDKDDDEPDAPVNHAPVLTDDNIEGELGKPVTVDVLGNDADDKGIDPATVRLLDKNDKPVTELKVPNEGTWTVDKTTGKVTFTPEDGFTGHPTPVQYIAKDKEGKPAELPAVIDIDYPKPEPTPEPQPKSELELIKTVTEQPNDAKAGDKIEYTFTVKNIGEVVVKNISINDPKLGITNLVIDPKELAPNQTGTVKATYIITQADIDSGKIVNTATVTGKDPSGKDITDISDSGTPADENGDGNPNNDPTVTDLADNHKIELFKKSIVSSKAGVGDEITYIFTVKNTGNVTVKDIKITDEKLADKVLEIGDLAPNDSKEISAQYIITQDDVNNGEVINSAKAEGTDPQGHKVTDDKSDSTNPADKDKAGDDDPTVTSVDTNPETALIKVGVYEDTDGNGKVNVGDSIKYTFTVENIGNVTVKDIVINDETINVSGLTIDKAELLPGEKGTATASYTLTQDDIDKGGVTNTAVAKGKDPKGNDVIDTSDDPNNPTDSDPDGDGNPDDPTLTSVDTNPETALIKV